MKYLLKVLNALSVLVIVAALLVLLAAVFTPAGEVPSVAGYSFLRTLTGSMEPAIPVHSLVVVERADANELEVGDVITFKSTNDALEGSLNTHRIVAVDDSGAEPVFRTKGDANVVEDAEAVRAENVVGRVVFVSAGVGIAASLLSNPLLFFPLIVMPLTVLLVIEIARMVRSAQEVAHAEDELALREAVEEIRRRRAAAAAADGPAAGEVADVGEPGGDSVVCADDVGLTAKDFGGGRAAGATDDGPAAMDGQEARPGSATNEPDDDPVSDGLDKG